MIIITELLSVPQTSPAVQYCQFGTQEVDKTKPTPISSLSLKHQNFLHIKTLETERTIILYLRIEVKVKSIC